MAELALHHLDLVLAGQAAAHNSNLRLSSRLLSSSEVGWFGPAALVHKADVDDFPQSLSRLPVLLPTAHSPLRGSLDRWFDELQMKPRVVGEFEDSALMSVFGLGGLGVFPASLIGRDDLSLMKGLKLVGQTEVKEDIYALTTRRSRHHPLVEQVMHSAQD
jgi:LysR family transcriptional activator of nhaA